MKEEALKLADWLDNSINADDWGELAKYYKWCHENVSPMIRRLVEELDKHKEIDGVFDYYCDENIRSKQTKPLSDDEIDKLADEYLSDYFNMQETINFVKAIEERHGIK